MKVLYRYTKEEKPIYINTPEQQALIVFSDNSDVFVYYSNTYLNKVYINRIIKFSSFWNTIDNLEVIQDDSQFKRYYSWVCDTSNFQGLEFNEKLDFSL